jgi:hypothetical protein
MSDEWKWPEPPYTMARDVIATYFRNWGRGLAYKTADDLIIELGRAGFQVITLKKTVRRPFVPETEEEAAEAMDNGRNTGGKSYK